MTNDEMWNNDNPLSEYIAWIPVPEWINEGFSPADAIAVYEGGCASGAYLPAVTYCDAISQAT